jgi:hypothetical protein
MTVAYSHPKEAPRQKQNKKVTEAFQRNWNLRQILTVGQTDGQRD